MAKRVFFSFDYMDVADFRANVVRKHWMTKPGREVAGFFDASIWESTKKKGSIAVKRLINFGLTKTTVTCVLIGSRTYKRRWVRYEILRSFKRDNNLVGIHINSIKGKDSRAKVKGPNPLDYLGVKFSPSGRTVTMLEWKNDRWNNYLEVDGRASFQVEPVAQKYRGRGFKLSKLYETYDWVKDDGYNKFVVWVR